MYTMHTEIKSESYFLLAKFPFLFKLSFAFLKVKFKVKNKDVFRRKCIQKFLKTSLQFFGDVNLKLI